MKLGVCCAENGFPAVGKSGFSYAEIATAFVRGKDNASILELKKRAEENGLTIDGFNGFFTGNISLYNDPIDKLLDFSEEAFNAAAVLGASYCVVGSGAYRAVPEGMDREKAYELYESYGSYGKTRRRVRRRRHPGTAQKSRNKSAQYAF